MSSTASGGSTSHSSSWSSMYYTCSSPERGDGPDNVESDADDIEKAGMDQDLSKTKVDRDLPKAYTTLEQCLGSPGSPQPPTSVYWVRMSSIRNHDNEAFSNALSEPQARLRCVFIIDPWYMCAQGKKKLGLNRLRFMLESLHDLQQQLAKYNTSLYVIQGHPLAMIEKVCDEWNVTNLFFQADKEVRSYILEESVTALARSKNIKVMRYQGHTLYDLNMVNVKHPITTMKDFRHFLPHMGPPNLPCDMPPLPSPSPREVEAIPEEYRIPSLSDLGYSSSEMLYTNKSWIGGESEALKRLSVYFKKRKDIKKPMFHDLLDNSSLSPYIRFGCLSVRYFLFKMRELASTDPSYEALSREVTSKLLHREFYFLISMQVSNFDQYADNAICLQLPWERDDFLFNSWKEGRTGYPWIDAAMRQLKQEGWIHHCLRESVATFLTRGDLWQSWVEGKDIFQELMLDFEPCVSCGCWMKSSCSAFITGPIEHYCPVSFGKKMDPHGHYIRRYIPELKHYPDEIIFCPWMASPAVQMQAGCRVGVEYPAPIIDHRTAGVLCCEKLKSVMHMYHLQVNRHTTRTS